MKRWLAICVLAVLVASSTGCGGGGTQKPSSGTQGKPAAEATAESPAPAAGPVAIAPSTARETAALKIAGSDAGRKWAMGNPNGSMGSAEGEPVIIGYQVQFETAKSFDSVVVIDGQVSRFFGKPGGEFTTKDAVVSGPKSFGTPNYEQPEGTAQKAAFESAAKYLAANGYDASKGGIEGILVVFPRVKDGNFGGQDPGVTVFARASLGEFASGGPSVRY